MYSTQNEGKSIIAARFIRTLKNKMYMYIASISKNVCSDKFDKIVNEYCNEYHSAIKMKPADVKSNTYINSSKEINDNDHKSKVCDHVKMTKFKNIFPKGHV